MSTTDVRGDDGGDEPAGWARRPEAGGAGPSGLGCRDRADAFYRGLGWRVDADVTIDGSACSNSRPQAPIAPSSSART